MNIGLDMMGGDYAPREAAKGIHLYLTETKSPANLFRVPYQFSAPSLKGDKR